jgi:chromosome segregation ATPase
MGKKSNIEHLKDLISKDSFSKEEALEFLEAVADEIKDLEEEFKEMEKEKNELEIDMDELKEEMDETLVNEIDCGIGKITWEADNLLLEQLMENLANRIASSTPVYVSRLLCETPKANKEVQY